MSVVVITPPTASPVDVSVARRHLHIESDTTVQDDDIQRLIDAATGQIDGPSGWLGRALVAQTLELRLHGFCGPVILPYPPFGAVTSVKFDDVTGTEQTVDAGSYRVIGGDRPVLILAANASWPQTSGQSECVRVRYTAGYGATETDVPAAIRQAILLMVQMLYGTSARDLFLSSETVAGVSTFQYAVNPNVALVLRNATENLLSTYMVRVEEPLHNHLLEPFHGAFHEMGRLW